MNYSIRIQFWAQPSIFFAFSSMDIQVIADRSLTVTLRNSVKFLIILHKVWQKHPYHQDYLGFYTLDSHLFSSNVHGLLGKMIWSQILAEEIVHKFNFVMTFLIILWLSDHRHIRVCWSFPNISQLISYVPNCVVLSTNLTCSWRTTVPSCRTSSSRCSGLLDNYRQFVGAGLELKFARQYISRSRVGDPWSRAFFFKAYFVIQHQNVKAPSLPYVTFASKAATLH